MVSPESLDIARRASAIYEERLKLAVEATHRDEFLTIEPDSGDYFIGRTMREAIDAARAAHPTKRCYVVRIGHAAVVEIGGVANERPSR
ncbi:MAG: hypothetical protein JNM56_23660 [Planctomycetia bacterium]|nr:hypothetical protein [Planctomycetia bacterium]